MLTSAETALSRVYTSMVEHAELDPTQLPYLPGREPRSRSKSKGKKGKDKDKGGTSPRSRGAATARYGVSWWDDVS